MRELAEKLKELPPVSSLGFKDNITFYLIPGITKVHASHAARNLGFKLEERTHSGLTSGITKYLRFSLSGKTADSECVLMVDDAHDEERLKTRPLVTIWADKPKDLPNDWRDKVVKLVRRLAGPRLKVVR